MEIKGLDLGVQPPSIKLCRVPPGQSLPDYASVRSSKHVEKVSSTMAASLQSFSDKELSGIEIVIRCVAKGYQECRFQVKTGETFTSVKKVGDKGCAFKILDPKRGQVGHLQRELVPVLWLVTSNITWYDSVVITLNYVTVFQGYDYG